MKKLSITENPEKSQLTNTGSKQFVKMKLVSSIKTAEPFTTVFPINDSLLDTIVEDMKRRGFDASQPLLMWKEREVVLDGHTRLKAAEKAGVQQVPVYEKSFESESEALEYVIHLQKDRRNLTDSELYACIMELDKRLPIGRQKKTERENSSTELVKSGTDSKGESSSRKKTAQVVGTSPAKVQKARTIQDYGDKKTKKALSSGEMSINRAYNETQKQRKKKADNEKVFDGEVYWDNEILYVVDNASKTEVLELKEDIGEKGKEKVRKVVYAVYEGKS